MNDQPQLPENEDEGQWISISDMMAGLMVIFLFVALSFMLDAQQKKNKIKKIAVVYRSLQKDLYNELHDAFKDKQEEWDVKVEIDPDTLSVSFRELRPEPKVLFEEAKWELQEDFKTILDEFFPEYVRILAHEKYRCDIEEIRIEGHTSSKWTEPELDKEPYILNMELSQNRARSVLEYVLSKPSPDSPVLDNLKWLQDLLTANGLSSSKLLDKDGNLIKMSGKSEDERRSRRVEFRVRMNAEKRIVEIIEKEGLVE